MKKKNEDQPLIKVERKEKKRDSYYVEFIRLITKSVCLPGLEERNINTDNTRRKFTSKTKMRPADKIRAIKILYSNKEWLKKRITIFYAHPYFLNGIIRQAKPKIVMRLEQQEEALL